MAKKSKLSILTNGIIKENPVLVLLIGTCPTLATSSSVQWSGNGSSPQQQVLICSNIVISLLRKVIPDKVRIPCYIVVIAGFVTLVQFVLQAYVPSLYQSLGLFLPLIVVNCIILGRAEAFANKNNIIDSALDGVGMGLGFTLTLGLMGAIRELLGAGTLLGYTVFVPGSHQSDSSIWLRADSSYTDPDCNAEPGYKGQSTEETVLQLWRMPDVQFLQLGRSKGRSRSSGTCPERS